MNFMRSYKGRDDCKRRKYFDYTTEVGEGTSNQKNQAKTQE